MFSIPNVSTLYQRIHSGSEGGHEFARFIKLLLTREYSKNQQPFISESDASGDHKKVDGYIPGDSDFPDSIVGFQFKFYPAKLSQNQKREIKKSIEKALLANEQMQEFILITPEDFMKEEQLWFDEVKSLNEHRFELVSDGLHRFINLSIQHWGHTKIIELCLKYPDVGKRYFPELFPKGESYLSLSKATLDFQNCHWFPFDNTQTSFYTRFNESLDNKTSNPLFDFQFLNNTNEIHLLRKIEIHIEKIWSVIKGIPQQHKLISLGTEEHNMDFSQPINTINFEEPIIFNPKAPLRFKVQLNQFEKCPGNWITLKFAFHFDDTIIPTDSFSLSL